MLNIFIGYDSKEPIAYHVCAHSILTRTRFRVAISPLVQPQLREEGLYARERSQEESTEFSLTRFLVPYLCNYKGWSLFLDCDMLCLSDIHEVLNEVMGDDKAVYCCQHDYIPIPGQKFLGNTQTVYPRKNWTSFMLFNNAKCRALTPSYVDTATGLELHRLLWLGDSEIGSIPLDWNYLVGEYPYNSSAKMLHFTRGGPWFPDFRTAPESELWRQELKAMLGESATVYTSYASVKGVPA